MTDSLPLLPTSVIGSHGKPGWWFAAVKAHEAGEFGDGDLDEMFDDAVNTAVRDMEEAGIDIPSDGEMRRAGFFTAEFYRHITGVERLGGLLAAAIARGGDVGHPQLLRRFEAGHRAATLPLYRATNMIVRLFTDERPLARATRDVAMGLAARLPPVRRAVSAMLTQHAPRGGRLRLPPLPRLR